MISLEIEKRIVENLLEVLRSMRGLGRSAALEILISEIESKLKLEDIDHDSISALFAKTKKKKTSKKK